MTNSPQPTVLQPSAVPRLLRPGMTVFCAGSMGHPQTLVDAIVAAPEATRDVRFLVTRAPGFGHERLRAPHGSIATFFGDRALEGAPEVELLPMQYRRIYDFLQHEKIDLALTQLAPPTSGSSECSFGLGVDFLPALLDRSDTSGGSSRTTRLVAELNSALPSLPGSGAVPLDRIEAIVSSQLAPPELKTRSDAATDRVGREIGRHVATLVSDGDCLQTGVGAIPDAVLAALSAKKDLGFHSGMSSDGVLDLVESGALNGRRKTRDQGKIVVGFLYGSQRLYRWAEQAQELLLRPVSYTHDPVVISTIDRFLAINSAIEVDLLGQVNGERAGGRQISGTGGSIDFCRGAARSPGGRSIVAMPSTAAGGKRSRIVPRLGEGSVATLTRTDVDFVVTEHGIAQLAGRTERQRAEALIGIAAPKSRDALVAAAEDLL